jgi:hypothetical protein
VDTLRSAGEGRAVPNRTSKAVVRRPCHYSCLTLKYWAMNMGTQAHVLNSWKEIAAYLHCSVRSVQRWARTLGLPTHRATSARRGSVFAFASELDFWVRRLPMNGTSTSSTFGTPAEQTRALLRASESLRAEVQRSRDELTAAISQLSLSVQKVSAFRSHE